MALYKTFEIIPYMSAALIGNVEKIPKLHICECRLAFLLKIWPERQ